MFSVSVCLWSSFCVFLGVFVIFFVFFCVDKLHLQSVPLRYVTVRGACWLLVLATPMKLRHPFSDVHSHFCFLVFNKYHHKLFFFFLPSCPGVCEIKKTILSHFYSFFLSFVSHENSMLWFTNLLSVVSIIFSVQLRICFIKFIYFLVYHSLFFGCLMEKKSNCLELLKKKMSVIVWSFALCKSWKNFPLRPFLFEAVSDV